jgi:hypothetical protein
MTCGVVSEPRRRFGLAAALAASVLVFPPIASAAFARTLVISEFRLSGPNGPNDEFIEIYNNSDSIAHRSNAV